ncbi:MAG: glycosyltransferase [Acetobacteraceae bacterium]|nr:glycosyltransferase [Acetobacteraceae bacterium]
MLDHRQTEAEPPQGAPAAALALPRDGAPATAATEHRLAQLGEAGLLLLELQATGPLPRDGTTTLVVGGAPLAPPTASLTLGPADAPRLVFAARSRAGALAPGTPCEVRKGGETIAAFRLDLPIPAEALLLAGRAPAERYTLLRFLVGTCAPALRATTDPGLAAVCHALARAAVARGAEAGAARALSRPDAAFSAWAVPHAPDGAWYLLTRGSVRRIEAPVAGILLLDGAPPPGALLLPPAPARPLPFAPQTSGGGTTSRLPTVATLLRTGISGTSAAGRRVLTAFTARAARDPRCAALLREAQLLAPARPQRLDDPTHPLGGALELALSDREGGVFLCGWVRDPLGLLAGLELRGPLGAIPLPPEALHRVPRPDLEERFARAAFGRAGPTPGFVAHLPDADRSGVAQWRLGLRLRSGEAIELAAAPALLPPVQARDLVLRSVHPKAVTPALLDNCLGPAAARLHRAALRAIAGTPEVVAIGRRSPSSTRHSPRASLIVPLYRNMRFLRFQVCAFGRDSQTRGADLVFVLDSPEQRSDVEHLLRGLSAMLDLPMTLVVMPANGGYAAACNAGAAAAHPAAATLVFLNSDVLPAAPGWLGRLLGRLARDRRLAAVGPKLLFDDGSVQHAGLFFRRAGDGEWFNDHYAKGFPRTHPAAARARRVPGVTGAALCVRRSAFEAAGGFCTDYIVGDFEDSDLCLRLRALGHEIAYEPSAELFHFERQSIATHEGHARTLAGAYNRRLHHLRWGEAIAALMTRFPAA